MILAFSPHTWQKPDFIEVFDCLEVPPELTRWDVDITDEACSNDISLYFIVSYTKKISISIKRQKLAKIR
jgi:hypothetical protein